MYIAQPALHQCDTQQQSGLCKARCNDTCCSRAGCAAGKDAVAHLDGGIGTGDCNHIMRCSGAPRHRQRCVCSCGGCGAASWRHVGRVTTPAVCSISCSTAILLESHAVLCWGILALHANHTICCVRSQRADHTLQSAAHPLLPVVSKTATLPSLLAAASQPSAAPEDASFCTGRGPSAEVLGTAASAAGTMASAAAARQARELTVALPLRRKTLSGCHAPPGWAAATLTAPLTSPVVM